MLDIKAYSLTELKTLAAEKKITGRSAMNKADLYAALSALESAAAKDLETVQESVQEYYGFGGAGTETFIEPIGEWSIDIFPVEDYPQTTVREALEMYGWKRIPRKLKKYWRAVGALAPAA